MSSKQQRRRTRPNPRTANQPAGHPSNALAAEATGGMLGFEFRGHRFDLDVASIDWGKAAFAINVAQRGAGSLMSQASLMVDAFEASLGEDNLVKLYEVAPDLFSSASTQQEFWESFARTTIGGSAGESPAS